MGINLPPLLPKKYKPKKTRRPKKKGYLYIGVMSRIYEMIYGEKLYYLTESLYNLRLLCAIALVLCTVGYWIYEASVLTKDPEYEPFLAPKFNFVLNYHSIYHPDKYVVEQVMYFHTFILVCTLWSYWLAFTYDVLYMYHIYHTIEYIKYFPRGYTQRRLDYLHEAYGAYPRYVPYSTRPHYDEYYNYPLICGPENNPDVLKANAIAQHQIDLYYAVTREKRVIDDAGFVDYLSPYIWLKWFVLGTWPRVPDDTDSGWYVWHQYVLDCRAWELTRSTPPTPEEWDEFEKNWAEARAREKYEKLKSSFIRFPKTKPRVYVDYAREKLITDAIDEHPANAAHRLWWMKDKGFSEADIAAWEKDRRNLVGHRIDKGLVIGSEARDRNICWDPNIMTILQLYEVRKAARASIAHIDLGTDIQKPNYLEIINQNWARSDALNTSVRAMQQASMHHVMMPKILSQSSHIVVSDYAIEMMYAAVDASNQHFEYEYLSSLGEYDYLASINRFEYIPSEHYAKYNYTPPKPVINNQSDYYRPNPLTNTDNPNIYKDNYAASSKPTDSQIAQTHVYNQINNVIIDSTCVVLSETRITPTPSPSPELTPVPSPEPIKVTKPTPKFPTTDNLRLGLPRDMNNPRADFLERVEDLIKRANESLEVIDANTYKKDNAKPAAATLSTASNVSHSTTTTTTTVTVQPTIYEEAYHDSPGLTGSGAFFCYADEGPFYEIPRLRYRIEIFGPQEYVYETVDNFSDIGYTPGHSPAENENFTGTPYTLSPTGTPTESRSGTPVETLVIPKPRPIFPHFTPVFHDGISSDESESEAEAQFIKSEAIYSRILTSMQRHHPSYDPTGLTLCYDAFDSERPPYAEEDLEEIRRVKNKPNKPDPTTASATAPTPETTNVPQATHDPKQKLRRKSAHDYTDEDDELLESWAMPYY